VLEPSVVDDLIQRCDTELDVNMTGSVVHAPFAVFRQLQFFGYPRIPNSPSTTPLLEPKEFEMVRQYSDLLVPIVVPIHDHRNPWANYPTLALQYKAKGQSYLFHAVLANVAFYLANTRSERNEFRSIGTKYHTMAMEELRMALSQGKTDSVSLFTTIITFMFIEVSFST
jgi:hypothetical protein